MSKDMTPKQVEWLLVLDQCPTGYLSRQMSKPPTIVMNALLKKGLCTNIMDTFWKITDLGREVAAEIKAKDIH